MISFGQLVDYIMGMDGRYYQKVGAPHDKEIWETFTSFPTIFSFIREFAPGKNRPESIVMVTDNQSVRLPQINYKLF